MELPPPAPAEGGVRPMSEGEVRLFRRCWDRPEGSGFERNRER